MPSKVGSILKRATREFGQPLNIISFPTHERTSANMAGVNANFYLLQGGDGIKEWRHDYAALPANHILLPRVNNPNDYLSVLPGWVQFDAVLAQHKFGQYQYGRPLANYLGIPLIQYEHTLPIPQWPMQQIDALKQMSGDVNLFISDYSRHEWKFDETNSRVLEHGVDTRLFKDNQNARKNQVLAVVNDWINRDHCCNFQTFKRVVLDTNLPNVVLGDTPGLSRPAADVNELVQSYNESSIFICTANVSPISSALLEAMACGCAVVAWDACMVPEVIVDGVNGYRTTDEGRMHNLLRELLENPARCRELGAAARATIQSRFSLDNFTANWNDVLEGLF